MPSVVRYLENGEVIVGYEALEEVVNDAENTFSSTKRIIGKTMEEIFEPKKQIKEKKGKKEKKSNLIIYYKKK